MQNILKTKSLCIEIGFGNADFLIRKSRSYPQKSFLGIEYSWASVSKGLFKIGLHKNKNIRLMLCDARVVFSHFLYPRCVSEIYALFPDPWFKRKHEKHRLFSRSFFLLANNRLVNKGTLEIVTDDLPYFKWIIFQAQNTGFRIIYEPVTPRFNTKYEKKWVAQGKNEFYRIFLTKEKHIEHIERKNRMQNYWIKKFDPERFHPKDARGDIAVTFKEFLFDPKHLKTMIRIIVVEKRLTQEFWASIAKKRRGWHICVAEGCFVVPTPGINYAIGLVREAAA